MMAAAGHAEYLTRNALDGDAAPTDFVDFVDKHDSQLLLTALEARCVPRFGLSS